MAREEGIKGGKLMGGTVDVSRPCSEVRPKKSREEEGGRRNSLNQTSGKTSELVLEGNTLPDVVTRHAGPDGAELWRPCLHPHSLPWVGPMVVVGKCSVQTWEGGLAWVPWGAREYHRPQGF